MRALQALVGLLVLCLSGCTSQPADPIPPHETFELVSAALGETRRINVYLPPDYAASTTRLPVLYLPDGGLAEDFPHVANTIDELIRSRVIAPCLVVGIENTQRRRDLSGPTEVAEDRRVAPVVGGSAKFRAFVADELVPAVEARYRCTAERAIVGESLAGLFVVETLLLMPELFDRYLAMSPSLWWNDRHLVRIAKERLAALPATPRTLWFTTANETDIAPHCDALAEILTAAAPATLTWTYAPRKDLTHQTIFRGTKAAAFAAALWRP